MEQNNILYVPIQINGGNKTLNELVGELKDRELYVSNDGTLYVGVANGSDVEVKTVVGRIVPNATIINPSFSGTVKIDSSMVYSKVEDIQNPVIGGLYLIDEGNFESSV
jgi:hypothetical protein